MTQESHNRIVVFIWSIADDCLRDVYVRGKYRDVILPMVVLRRLDALLEETKEEVMKEFSFQRKEIGITNWGDLDALRRKSGYKFYNTSKTHRDHIAMMGRINPSSENIIRKPANI